MRSPLKEIAFQRDDFDGRITLEMLIELIGPYVGNSGQVPGNPSTGTPITLVRTAIGAGTESIVIATAEGEAAPNGHSHSASSIPVTVPGLVGTNLEEVLQNIATRLAALEAK